jgi:magnesium transporter
MGEILRGLDRERIASLRAAGTFFWVDVPVAPQSAGELGEVLGIPEHALEPLMALGPGVHRASKFHVDADHVVFPFTCFDEHGAIEVHLLVSGEYLLTAHTAPVSLPDLLEIEAPAGRSEQYLIYAVLEAMVVSAFAQLADVEDEIEKLQADALDLRTARIRNDTLRGITAQLTRLRREVAPQRGTFDRVADEIGRVEGLESDSERYFDRIADQINRLVDAIDAAADAVTRFMDLRLNETTYWLTVVATVFLPLTFVTGFFGMNFAWMIKHLTSPLAFLVLGVGGCTLGVLVTLIAVRRRGAPG